MTEHSELPPIRLAFILDGVVQDIINTDERLAAILLSEPLVIDVTPEIEGVSAAFIGDVYFEGKFLPKN